MRFANVYWDPVYMRNDDLFPSILGIRDSWFWYPFPGGSLLNDLVLLVAPHEHVILAYGDNAAEAFNYARGTYPHVISGAGHLGSDGSPWSMMSFRVANVPAVLRNACIVLLLDALTKMLTGLTERYPARVFLVHSRSTLQVADWANELHATPGGFDKIAARWKFTLRQLGLAS